jgi:hypothetical protein
MYEYIIIELYSDRGAQDRVGRGFTRGAIRYADTEFVEITPITRVNYRARRLQLTFIQVDIEWTKDAGQSNG